MARYVIVTLPGQPRSRRPPFEISLATEEDRADPGCAWLFRASAEVADAEEALKSAVREFMLSPEGEAALGGESDDWLDWCEALGWVPDEIWERHGLRVFRHPDVERILLDPEEDVAEALSLPGR
ncbi:MAG TPA: hypothetical protein VF167_15615 [Longimicrobiaceae bacterium]